MSRIFDCFMFNNELDMLELRMNILGDVVDEFVIVEAGMTHSGNPKPYTLDLARFQKWKDKIIYHQVPYLEGDNGWIRERNHRSAINEAVNVYIDGHDWMIVSDVDEIPDPSLVDQLRGIVTNTAGEKLDLAKFELDFYYYNFNCRVKQGWAIGAARAKRVLDANKIRRCDFPETAYYVAFDGGWHLSYFMTPQEIINKNRAFMHHADPIIRDLPNDTTYVQDCIDNCIDLYGRDLKLERVLLSDTLPQYVLDNQDKYSSLGWIVWR